jgi:hypothetical protein
MIHWMMTNMSTQYKVIQCPHCLEYTYLPVEMRQNFCPRCNGTIALHQQQGTPVISIREAQRLIQQEQRTHQDIQVPGTRLRPAEQVLQLLRSYHSDTPKWLPIHEIFQRSIEAGLLPKEVHDAIETLQAEGFLEKRDDTIRAIPLN